MNRKLFLSLMICALVLAGCYRQTAESFQQVDSVTEIISPTETTSTVELPQETEATPLDTPDASAASSEGAAVTAPTATSLFITPQLPPAQVEQPIIIIPTSSAPTAARPAIPVTAAITGIPGRGASPTPTATLDELDPANPCVYEIAAGNTLFNLSLTYDTTVDDLMELNELEDESLQIGQLLRIPDCAAGDEAAISTVEADSGGNVATVAPVDLSIDPTPAASVFVHIVQAGDTLGGIAQFYDISENRIAELNDMVNRDQLSIGQRLTIPDE